MAAEARVEFTGVDAGLEDHIEGIEDRLGGMGGMSMGAAAVMGAAGGVALSAFDRITDQFLETMQAAIRRNDVLSDSQDRLTASWDSLMDVIFEGSEVVSFFIDALADATEALVIYTKSLQEWAESWGTRIADYLELGIDPETERRVAERAAQVGTQMDPFLQDELNDQQTRATEDTFKRILGMLETSMSIERRQQHQRDIEKQGKLAWEDIQAVRNARVGITLGLPEEEEKRIKQRTQRISGFQSTILDAQGLYAQAQISGASEVDKIVEVNKDQLRLLDRIANKGVNILNHDEINAEFGF